MTPTTEQRTRPGHRRPWRAAIPSVMVVCLAALVSASHASASTQAPAWSVESFSVPTNFAPGSTFGSGGDAFVVTASNVGEAPSDGTAVTITDTLPSGVSLDAAGASGFGSCSSAGQVVTCTSSQVMQPGQVVELQIPVDVAANALGTLTNTVTVSGGGGAAAAASSATSVSSAPAGFGVQLLDGSVSNADGSTATQGGSHPDQMTTTVVLNSGLDSQGHLQAAGGDMKDVQVNLPAGLAGDPQATPRCTQQQFGTLNAGGQVECPDSAAVGEVTVLLTGTCSQQVCAQSYPVYNLVAPPGEPAQLGFAFVGVPVWIDLHVWPQSDGYRVTASLSNVNQSFRVLGSELTVWGNPTDPVHDRFRGSCLNVDGGSAGSCPASGVAGTPFLTLPTQCSRSLTTTGQADSWTAPGSLNHDGTPHLTDPNWATASYVSHDATGNPVGITGCNQLDFSPTVSIQPDTSVADSPSGLNFDLKLPTSGLLNPTGLAESALKKAVVTLPQGVSVDPSRANGLDACSPAQIGLGNASEPTCPDASKIGSVEVDTPLLPDPLKGSIYVAQQGAGNPFGTLLAGYIVAQGDGVLVKIPGRIDADPVTGQLTATFDDNPQLPFSELKVDFFGGPHGALATPDQCGTYTTSTQFTPWSAPDSGPPATPGDSFSISSGCMSGFAPSFTALSENPQAGAYSPFVLSFSRSDTDQYLSGLAVKLPEGMLAKLAGVGQCSDAQLAQAASKSGAAEQANPSCPAGAQVGTVTTGAGPGPDSYFIGGRAYLTGPYKGAPYGLAVVVPALAGPFDLGTVVVRTALYVDPTTAQVTAVSDPFPTILEGIPLRLRRVDVSINRPGFTLNPTSCNPMTVNGILSSTGGLGDGFTPRFQVGGCQGLGFSPRLSISLTGRGRTRSGAHPNLTATLTQPGGQANIRSARVALPLSLALDTANSSNVCNYDVAQKVHGGAVGCPANTIVGQASAVTPLLDKPLTGPVYLVQGIRFGPGGRRIHTLPSLLVPLRGQIALDLRASSSVNGAQQLVTTFSTIPDAPVSKFTLTINGGPRGILVITGRGRTICGQPQIANAQFAAQSGKAESPNPRLATPACRGFHKPKRPQRPKRRRHHR